MTIKQTYVEGLYEFVKQNPEWQVSSQEPFTVERQESDESLPLAVTLYGKDDEVHVCINLYANKKFVALAHNLLKSQQEEKITTQDEDSGLNVLIDADGFAIVQRAIEPTEGDLLDILDALIEKSESILVNLVAKALEVVKQASGNPDQSEPAEQDTSNSYLPIVQSVKKYLDGNGYKYKHDEDKKRFVFGFNTDKYRDRDGDASLQIVIIYSDDDLLRFTTPFLYQFDLKQTDYSLIASAIAWLQFEYKFLSMSLDPNDGELRVSIDIPMADGKVHPDQVRRIVTFILQFTEVSYEELFSLLLKDSARGQAKLDSLIADYRKQVESHRWLGTIEERLKGVSEEQKQAIDKAIESILEQGDKSREQGGI